ncbi:MAG: hypothetical protein FH758_08095 [Firmicutes bacterium]|nr:hypothetical protein [Bacillota bacterium]
MLYRLISIAFLVTVDQFTRYMYSHSIWYTINLDKEGLKGFFLIYITLLVLVIIKFAVKYDKLYGYRPLFNCFFVLFIAAAISRVIDMIIFSGGRDFIPIGSYIIANPGDFYYFLSLVILAIELYNNKKGRLSDFIKPL